MLQSLSRRNIVLRFFCLLYLSIMLGSASISDPYVRQDRGKLRLHHLLVCTAAVVHILFFCDIQVDVSAGLVAFTPASQYITTPAIHTNAMLRFCSAATINAEGSFT